MSIVGKKIAVEGYGQLKGEKDTVTVVRLEGSMRAVLQFAQDGKTYEVPFRLADGAAVGGSPEGGFAIPQKTLAALKEEAGAAAKGGGKSDTSIKNGPAGSAPAQAGKRGTSMASATATAPAPAASKGRRKTGTPTPTPPAEPEAAASNGKGKVKPAAPAASVSTAKKNGAAAPPAKPAAAPAPATRGRKPAAPAEETEEEEDREPSPMELADRSKGAVPEGSVEVNLSPLMFRQIRWNEIRPFPEGRKVPGFSAFKKAMDAANERSYVYIVVNEQAAKFLVERAFVNGFRENWTGSLSGGFKRAAKRIAQTLAEAFGFTVPASIAQYAGSSRRGKADEEEEEEAAPVAPKGRGKTAPAAPAAPPARGGRKPAPAAVPAKPGVKKPLVGKKK